MPFQLFSPLPESPLISRLSLYPQIVSVIVFAASVPIDIFPKHGRITHISEKNTKKADVYDKINSLPFAKIRTRRRRSAPPPKRDDTGAWTFVV
jgi:hypothetical protein